MIYDLKIRRQDYKGYRESSLPMGIFTLGSVFSTWDVVLRFKQNGATIFELQSTVPGDGLTWVDGTLNDPILTPAQMESLFLPGSMAKYTISVEKDAIKLVRVRGLIDIQPSVEDI